MAAANLHPSASPEPGFDPDNDIDWHPDEIFHTYPRILLGGNLHKAALHYTNDELMEKADQHRAQPYHKNNFTKFLTKEIDEYAIEKGEEPDSFRGRFEALRAANILKTHGYTMPRTTYTMPANIASIPPNPSLQELGVARAAYLPHTPSRRRFPSEYWVKLNHAIRAQAISISQFAKALGFTNERSAENHRAHALSRGSRLAPILANMPPAPVATAPAPATNASNVAPAMIVGTPVTTTAHRGNDIAQQTSKKRSTTSETGLQVSKKAKITLKGPSKDKSSAPTPPSLSTAADTAPDLPQPTTAPKTASAQSHKRTAKTTQHGDSTSAQPPTSPSTAHTSPTAEVSERIRTALGQKAQDLRSNPGSAVDLLAMVDLMKPLFESGEDLHSVATYKFYIKRIDLSNYGNATLGEYLAKFIDDHITTGGERGSFLILLMLALKNIDQNMKMMADAEGQDDEASDET